MGYLSNNLGLRIKTPSGWMDFAGIADMGEKPIWCVRLPHTDLRCSANHRLMTKNGLKTASSLTTADSILMDNGEYEIVVGSDDTGEVARTYDIIHVDGGHLYMTNGMVSHNCEFVTDDETLINPIFLKDMKYKKPEFYTDNVRWFVDEFEPNKPIVIGLDPSSGTGRDYAAIQVFQLPEMIQLGEWQSNLHKPRDQVMELLKILRFLHDELANHPDQESEPEIYWSVENNGLGEAILTVIDDTGLDMFPGQMLTEKKKKGQVRKFRRGFYTSGPSKASACARFKSLIETGRATINSEQLVTQLKMFVASGNSFKGKSGSKDDLVMAVILIVRMLEVAVKYLDDPDILREGITEDEIYAVNEPMPMIF